MKAAIPLLLLATVCAGLAGMAPAQSFPAKQVRSVVPFAAGGAIDIIARLLALPQPQPQPQPSECAWSSIAQ